MLMSDVFTVQPKTTQELVASLWAGDFFMTGKKSNASFTKGGKVYTYSLSAKQFAERYNLIPQIDVWEVSADVIRDLLVSGSTINYSDASDTVRALLFERVSKKVKIEFIGFDKYGYEVSSYSIRDN